MRGVVVFIEDGLTYLSCLFNQAEFDKRRPNAFDRCVAASDPEAAIRTSLQDGTSLGIQGTPTFFINGHIFPGAIDLETLELFYARLVPQPAV